MENKILVMTIGLPRSGKSTWARKQGYPVVNRDSVRLALHGNRFIKDAEEMVAAITKYMVKALFLAGHDVVILDECNIIHKRRDAWLSEDWEVRYKEFNTPKEVCIARAIETGQEDLLPVIAGMALSYDFVPVGGEMWNG